MLTPNARRAERSDGGGVVIMDQDGDTVEPSYERMNALQLMVELNRNIQAVSVGKITLDEANRRTRRINAVLKGRQAQLRTAAIVQNPLGVELVEGD